MMQVDIITQMYLNALNKMDHNDEQIVMFENGAVVFVTLHIDQMPFDKKN